MRRDEVVDRLPQGDDGGNPGCAEPQQGARLRLPYAGFPITLCHPVLSLVKAAHRLTEIPWVLRVSINLVDATSLQAISGRDVRACKLDGQRARQQRKARAAHALSMRATAFLLCRCVPPERLIEQWRSGTVGSELRPRSRPGRDPGPGGAATAGGQSSGKIPMIV